MGFSFTKVWVGNSDLIILEITCIRSSSTCMYTCGTWEDHAYKLWRGMPVPKRHSYTSYILKDVHLRFDLEVIICPHRQIELIWDLDLTSVEGWETPNG